MATIFCARDLLSVFLADFKNFTNQVRRPAILRTEGNPAKVKVYDDNAELYAFTFG